MYYSFYYINLLITMFLTIFRRFPKIFKILSEGCTNVSEHFPRISEVFRRLPRKIRRLFDLISIYFGSFSIGTWQTLQADWSKMISHMCGHVDIIFIHTCGIPFFSTCYHSLKHCSLYNKCCYMLCYGRRGGLVVSALDSGSDCPGSSPGLGTALCSWARYFALIVPLSTQVYKWVPAIVPAMD